MSESTTERRFVAEDVETELKQFLEKSTKTSWASDTDLFADGGVSSMFAMELVVHIERTFGLAIEGPDLRIDNFRTVNDMTALVLRLTGSDAGE
ncbi:MULTISPECIES: acyl carrier protein [unclassified Streptomyces]|uniref:acyl carrier protein n=1 Tax=unclassified Streptomyces TaxID=2593676 RepID=UPI000C280F3F|nr:acyl carrier protein [Streptomyces sp. CB02959]PJN42471.1 methoxymalonate biosynthesis protein [Streptomyces sp. CB02959]URG42925.1 acyl carrier protein [Streptomyces longshengensis]